MKACINGEMVSISQKEMDEFLAASAANEQESAAFQARSKRNQLLKDSDWTQGRDIPDSTAQLWAAYRQSLRDIPSQPGFPTDIEWPTKPTNNNESAYA